MQLPFQFFGLNFPFFSVLSENLFPPAARISTLYSSSVQDSFLATPPAPSSYVYGESLVF